VEVAALLRPAAVPGRRVQDWAPPGLVQQEYPGPAEAAALGSALAAAWVMPRAVPVRAALAEFPRGAEVLTPKEVGLSRFPLGAGVRPRSS
jgi:hypothetical protein